MPAAIVKTRQAWLNQAKAANDACQASGAKDLNEFAELDHNNFCLLIEAFHALRAPISKELMDKAQMRPVDEVLGLP